MNLKRKRARAIGLAVFFSLLWWTLTDGSPQQRWLGTVFVIAATAAALRAPGKGRRPLRPRIHTLVKFIPYFVYQSLKGGFLVAKLAVSPQRRIRSRYFRYEARIPAEDVPARMWFASALCVFPGTLSCGYQGDVLVIHALDEGLFDIDSIRKLEGMISVIFGLRP